MKDIAFHISDIAENGIGAGASRIDIGLQLEGQQFTLTIADNGRGMDEQTLRRATDPFYTTRTTRKVGLGLPFLFQNTAQCGGTAHVASEPGRGTCVTAVFPLDNIDCPPAGDLPATLMQLLAGNPAVEICVDMRSGEQCESISSSEILETLDGIPAGHPMAARLIAEMFSSCLEEVFGKRLI